MSQETQPELTVVPDLVEETVQEAVGTNDNEDFLDEEESQPVSSATNLEAGIDAAAEQFDVTRKAREHALDRCKQVLDRVSKGAKLNRADIVKAISGLYFTTIAQEDLLVNMIKDIMMTIKAIGISEGNIMQQGVQITTLARTLNKHGVVTEQQMQDTYKDEVMPMLKAQMPQTPANDLAGNDLAAKYQVPSTEEK